MDDVLYLLVDKSIRMEVFITESQYERMKRALVDESIELDSNLHEYPGANDVVVSQITSDEDGNKSIDSGATTDDIANKRAIQAWDYNRGRRSAN